MSKIEKQVMCGVNRIAYDLSSRTGYVDLPDMNCTDMSGTIKLFKAIDPRVQRIIAGDVFYHRFGEEWKASDFPEKYKDLHVCVDISFDTECREKVEPLPFVPGDTVRFRKNVWNTSGRQTVGIVQTVDDRTVHFIDKDGLSCDGMLDQVEMVREVK